MGDTTLRGSSGGHPLVTPDRSSVHGGVGESMADASATHGDHQEKAGRRFRTPMFEKLLQPRRKKEQPAEPTPDEVIIKQGEIAGEATLATAQQLSSHTRNTLVVNKLQHEYAFAYDLLKECSVEDLARLGAEVEALHAKAKLKGLDLESFTTHPAHAGSRSAADDTTTVDSSANSLANLFGSGGGMFGQTSFTSSATANVYPSSAADESSAATAPLEGGASDDDAYSGNIKKKAPIAGRRKSTVFAPTQSHQQATSEIQEKQAQRVADGAANKQVTADWVKSAKLWPEKHCIAGATTATREGAQQPSTGDTTTTRYSHDPARSTLPRRPRALSECAEKSNNTTESTQTAASRNKVKQHQSRRHSDTSVEKKAAAARALFSPPSTAHQPAALSPSSVAVSNSTKLASVQQPQWGDASSDITDSASPAFPEAKVSRREHPTQGSRNISRRHFATTQFSPLTTEVGRRSDSDVSPLAGSTENTFSKSKPGLLMPERRQQNNCVPCDARSYGPATRAVPPRFITHQHQEPINSDEQLGVASRGSGLPSVSTASPPRGDHNVEPPSSSTSGATTNSATAKNNAKSRGGRRASLPSISGATDEDSSAPLAIVSPSMRNVPRGRQTGSGTSGMMKGRQQQQVLRIPHANPRLLQL